MKTCITLLLALALAGPALAQRTDRSRGAEPAAQPEKPATNRSDAEKIVNGPAVEGVGDTWATIAWTTNTGGSTVLKYGTQPNRLDQTAEAPYADNESTRDQTHRVQLKNLRPGTTYYFMATSGQGEGTGTQAASSVGQFTTKANAAREGAGRAAAVKIIDGPRVEGTGTNWAVIAWTTNTGGSSILRYGTSGGSLNQTAEAPYADNEGTQNQVHRVRLSNLKPGTTYFFMADSGQGEGTGSEARSSVQQFSTKAR